MEKVITFTNDQKSLIWQRFVNPAGGTEDEVKHFIEVCESFGLNPLLGDIVFQAYGEGAKRRVNFITTRDGLLRIASRQPDYVGPPNANVVREGDEFEFLPSKGDVKHKFGKKRGQILGAYAILKHKRFNPVAVFVDFEEYFNANSGVQNSKYGNANVWDKMPSAMIVKIAEVFVLRRQFPLGGLYTSEEMQVDESFGSVPSLVDEPVNKGNVGPEQSPKKNTQTEQSQSASKPQQETQPNPTSNQNQEEQRSQGQENDVFVISGTLDKREEGSKNNEPFAKLQVVTDDGKQHLVIAKGEEKKNMASEIPMGHVKLKVTEQLGFYFLIDCVKEEVKTSEQNKEIKQDTKQNTEDQPETLKQLPFSTYIVSKKEVGHSPSGIPYGKLHVVNTESGEKLSVLAQGQEGVDKISHVNDGDTIKMVVKNENGFTFLVYIN